MGDKISLTNGNPSGDDTILIREAGQIPEEGEIFAHFFDEAGEGFFKSMLGKDVYSIIADAYLKGNSGYSYENALFAQYENKIVGMISGYSYSDKQRFDSKILSHYSGGMSMRIRIFLLIERMLSRYLGPKDDEDYYLQSIAVSKEMRGKGVGLALMKSAVECGKKAGAKTLSLDVSSSNKSALRLYTKFGMVPDTPWPNIPFIPSLFTRLIIKIGN